MLNVRSKVICACIWDQSICCKYLGNFLVSNVDGGISVEEWFWCFYLCFRYNKRKYVEIQEAKKKGDGPYKRMRRLKKKKKIN